MYRTSPASKALRYLLMIITVLFFITCKKDSAVETTNVPPVINPVTPPGATPADLTTKIISSVSGFVTDENNVAVEAAVVNAGTLTATTDKYGFFEIKNAQVVKNAAVVSVSIPGYFKGIKTYIASEGKAAFLRIKLIPKLVSGTINATTGGSVTLTNGFRVSLPANAVVNASSGTAYPGTIHVASTWMDPTATDLKYTMPGDLRGLDTSSALKLLRTFGMAAVELTSDAGELLQVATGKKATLTMPIPSAILSAAPATIPLWYFDETTGLWKQDGAGTKTGNTYAAEVSHFSFWDYSTSGNYVNLDCTIKDANGNPIPNALIIISEASQPSNGRPGITDSTGYVAGAVPENSSLVMDIITDNGCVITLQTFTTATANISLGNIALAAANTATITGDVTDCNNTPVTDGFLIMTRNGVDYRYYISAGAFSFSSVLCGAANTADFIAEDHIGSQVSAALTNVTLNPGINNIGTINACGTSIEQFIIYDVNYGGHHEEFYTPADSVSMTTAGSPYNTIMLTGNRNVYDKTITLGLNNLGGASQIINYVLATEGTYTTVTATMPALQVVMTEYGPVGGFISGNFSGTIDMGLNGLGFMIGSFRVKRLF